MQKYRLSRKSTYVISLWFLSVFTLFSVSSVVMGVGSLEFCSDIYRASRDYNWLAGIKPQYNLSTSSSILSYLYVSVGETGKSISVHAILHSITCTMGPQHLLLLLSPWFHVLLGGRRVMAKPILGLHW